MEGLRKHFAAVGAKYLSKVDVGKQHEIGSNKFAAMLGKPEDRKVPFGATLIYLDDDQAEPLKNRVQLTWYDTRLMQPDRTPEYRLYYPANDVITPQRRGCFCIIAVRPDKSLLIIVTPPQSSIEQKLRWLFNIGTVTDRGFSYQDVQEKQGSGFIESLILEELGETIHKEDESWLDKIFARFGEAFPTTFEFSEFARNTCPGEFSPLHNPDDLLLEWVSHEEMLFRTLERYIVERQIGLGFKGVDQFVDFSLSVHNRRKSRVGYALEHHLAAIFSGHGLRFERQVRTELRSTVDFLFPGAESYRDEQFPSDKLFMLASKSTCKDRWRQVLAEAARIRDKHLLTLEPAISVHQTNEMRESNLQLVVPRQIAQTYKPEQRAWILDLESYIDMVRRVQK